MSDFTPLAYEDIDDARKPTLTEALVPVLVVVVSLGVGSGYLGLAPHAPLLWSITFTGLFARYHLGYDWERVSDAALAGLRMGLQAILILFVIYGLIATWTSAGTIPGLMYYGLGALTPAVFLPVTAILAAVVAFAIGSSWTTVGTLGVAFVGIGSGLGIPLPMTAGAIVSGAYAGDKQSPLSDTTNLAAAVTNADLYDHINGMRLGTAIAFGLSVLAYAVLGVLIVDGGAANVTAISGPLAGSYALGPLVFLPLVVTFGLAFRGYPALPSLVAGVFAGALTTIAVQGASFTAAWDIFLNGTTPETGSELVNNLLTTGGIAGSAWTIAVVVAALSLGGLLERTGVLPTLTHHLTRAIWSPESLVAGTGVAAIATNAFSAQQYMSIVVPSVSLRTLYDEYDLNERDLSRAVEAAGTPTGPFFPWHAGAVFMTGALYTSQPGAISWWWAPYYFFGILSPLVLFGLVLAGRGYDRAGSAAQPAAPAANAAATDDD
ncbi:MULTISPECIES: Na+/H+ antiporter NhaC family protein [Halobacterium]|uniref:arginine/ornithine antiporter ArcD n=1 Tax=Halobacterium TaxID=2239 RepID=UPI001965F035|nr:MULTISPECIES: Na+/H+ antiporter NhaC family protein [Halobacterium]MDL0122010.1 Na+/H+ antiporter NhaC family protein [Halobacterium salinarum]MDL0133256.1 Na+/H+ antiporter NhaC family protein [Halobacterium salinarum]QRY24397.1 Na+/H+ antiporter NhaC family protein [Halobacterium sp. BOL4-2]